MDSKCSLVVKNARAACGLKADLVKLALFGTFGKSGFFRTDCLWEIARKCNPRVRDAQRACLEAGLASGVVNFIQVDYPNYPASGDTTVVDFCFEQNLKRAGRGH